MSNGFVASLYDAGIELQSILAIGSDAMRYVSMRHVLQFTIHATRRYAIQCDALCIIVNQPSIYTTRRIASRCIASRCIGAAMHRVVRFTISDAIVCDAMGSNKMCTSTQKLLTSPIAYNFNSSAFWLNG